MDKSLWRSALRAIAALACTLAWTGGADAVVNVTACGTLGEFRQTYNVTTDLHADGGDCLVVANNGITINLQGHSIIQDTPTPFGSGVTDGGIVRDQTTVKNGTVTGFVFGVELDSSTRSQVLNVTVSESLLDGILVGTGALVKGATAQDNGFGSIVGGDGIHGADNVQVQTSVATNNGANGIRVGQRCLITQNKAEENFEDGINTGASCTITSNTASNNDDDGIDVTASGALVSLNHVNDNFDVGIRVVCRSTVTNNQASGNGTQFQFIGSGCVTNQAM